MADSLATAQMKARIHEWQQSPCTQGSPGATHLRGPQDHVMVSPLSGTSTCTTVRNTLRRSVAAGPWPRSLLLTPPRSA
eukprot:8039381-Alexandrium_andersonii.AAC.1